MSLSRNQLRYGRDDAPPARHMLRAGPLTAVLEGADLRRVRLGDIEVAQRIYVAVRDEVWNTIPAQYTDWQLDIADDHFAVGITANHRYQDIDFSWRGQIAGTAEGRISYTLSGVAKSDFRYCKIGFNVHHPPRGAVGRPFRAHSPTGPIEGVLPSRIAPQLFRDGQLTAMFAPYDSLTLEPIDGVSVRFDFEGDLFEMQDHRNWTDGNFKSYGTPLSTPYPMDAHPGQTLYQGVSLHVSGPAPERTAEARTVQLNIGQPLGIRLPPIGACMASHGGALSDNEAGLLRALQLDHLRVDLHLNRPGWQDELRRSTLEAKALGSRLEMALFVTDETDAEIGECATLLQALSQAPARVLVFEDSSGRSTVAGSTPGRLMRRVRERLRPLAEGVPLAGGTKQFFAEINRDPPDVDSMDAVVFSINPQVHACDDTSLVENLAAQADVVKSASSLCADRPIIISPVSFIGRDGPYAAGPPQPGGLPGNVDVRQASLFGAGWTAVSIKYLAQSGAASLTYYETTGWLGLIENDAGPQLPDLFPSQPGIVFPLYHIMANLADWKATTLLEMHTGDALTVDGLALRDDDGMHVLVANLTDRPQTVTIGPFFSRRVRLRLLDEENAERAMHDPAGFRATSMQQELVDGHLQLKLGPLALARIDEAGPP
jgi:hypothetical protein